jgi:hypothetical protein
LAKLRVTSFKNKIRGAGEDICPNRVPKGAVGRLKLA